MQELREAVEEVIKSAQHGQQRGHGPVWITAYQVLGRLPPELRARLVKEHEGYGGGAHDADRGTGAANAVMRVLRQLHSEKLVAIEHFDAYGDSQFCVGEDKWVHPGNVTCAIYKWIGG